jgi:hypothetical protein
MVSMDDIFSEFPQLRPRFEDIDGNVDPKKLSIGALFRNILSVYGVTDAIEYVDVIVISKDGKICIVKDKKGRMEDDVHPIDLVSLFVRLLKANLGCGIEVFDDMIETELSEFVVELMRKHNIRPMRENPHGKKENI